MVLPVRIELTTSALPRMRSTTELRQHSRSCAVAVAHEQCLWTRQDACGYCRGVARSDPEVLAAALRDNLLRRKARMRAAQAEGAAVVGHGSDEEGDVPPPSDGIDDDRRDGAWVNIGSKRL